MSRFLFTWALLAGTVLSAQDEIASLRGWRMREGDDARWAAPDFDDSAWAIDPPIAFGSRAFGASGFAPVTWYRVKYRIPPQWRGHALALGVWKLDDAYEVFAGGVKIGTFGSLPPVGTANNRAVTAFTFFRRAFPIPLEACREGEVEISIRRWRLPVVNAWELHEVAPFPSNNLPVVGLKGTVEREQEILSNQTYLRGLPGILAWLATLACGLVCLGMRRQGEDRELLWAGLALLALGASSALSLPMALAEWPKSSFIAFAWMLLSTSASSLFLGWFLAELVPEWRRPIRWASLFVAISVGVPYFSTYAWLPSWNFAMALRASGRVALFAICLGCAWQLWRSRRPGLAVAVAVAASATVTLGTTLWNSANYYRTGPFVFSLRRTSDALIAMAMATLLYARARRERKRQQDLAQDLEAARRVQETLLGRTETPFALFAADAVYLPAREVGGDFYQTLPAEDGSLLVLVGDVSGKGLQAAMLVASVIGSLRNEFSRSPGEVLAHLNRSLLGRTGGGFVTCCCARFDPDGTVTLANAGHLAPYSSGHEVPLESGLPLGLASGTEYGESQTRLLESMLFVSDGVIEAENPQRELFGFDRTREISGRTASEIAEAAQAWGQNDDITVVTVRRNA